MLNYPHTRLLPRSCLCRARAGQGVFGAQPASSELEVLRLRALGEMEIQFLFFSFFYAGSLKANAHRCLVLHLERVFIEPFKPESFPVITTPQARPVNFPEACLEGRGGRAHLLPVSAAIIMTFRDSWFERKNLGTEQRPRRSGSRQRNPRASLPPTQCPS